MGFYNGHDLAALVVLCVVHVVMLLDIVNGTHLGLGLVRVRGKRPGSEDKKINREK